MIPALNTTRHDYLVGLAHKAEHKPGVAAGRKWKSY